MSVLPELRNALASPLVSSELERIEGAVDTEVTVPSGANASDKSANSAGFNHRISDCTITDSSALSKDLVFFIDHLIVGGKINTMSDLETKENVKQVDESTLAKAYNRARENTDPSINMASPTTYLESVPPRLNMMGILGENDS